MAEETRERKLALENYFALCETLDKMDWKYTKEEDELIVRVGVSGDDIPMDFIIKIDEKRQLIRVLSFLPFKFDGKSIVDGSIATSQINYLLADGSFDFDVSDGSVLFRMTASYNDSLISRLLLVHMINYSCTVVDKYNDKLMMLANGLIDIKTFLISIAP